MHDGRLIAVASGGGHWEQMMLLKDAFSDLQCHYVTTNSSLAEKYSAKPYDVIRDCNKGDIRGLLLCVVQGIGIIRRVRPDYVISTGAAPGLILLVIARLAGAKTIWIDSIANAEQLSLSGRVAWRIADHCLTQWQHLASTKGPFFEGAVV